MSNDEPSYGLIMPFTVCASNGGPYDDASFVAGMRLESVSVLCDRGDAIIEKWVETPLVTQIDLVAMRFGYTMDTTPWDEYPDEWTWVTLRRITADV